MSPTLVRLSPVALALLLGAGAIPAQLTVTRVSVSPVGAEANAASPRQSMNTMALSADGQVIAFVSPASNLVPGDSNGVDDVFVRDLAAGVTERVSVSTTGQQMLADRYGRGCFDVAISGDGRYVAFSTAGSKLIDGEKGGGSRGDVYLRDRVAGTTARVSLSTPGGAPNGDSWFASLTPDGRYVAFYSNASNLVAGDRNRTVDVFVRDLWTSTNVRASVDSAGREANAGSMVYTNRALSDDGLRVVFVSSATNLVAGDTNGIADVFVRDLASGTTERVNLSVSGAQLSTEVVSTPAISGDGRFVTYVHRSSNPAELPPDVPLNSYQVFQFDRVLRTTTCGSRGPTGAPADQGVGVGFASSADGRFLAFVSRSTNLVPGFPGTVAGVFLRDSLTGLVGFVGPGLGGSWPDGSALALEVLLDATASAVGFASNATNLVPGDTNGLLDVFVAR